MPSAEARSASSERTSGLLTCGILIAPAFFTIVFAQALLRAGFDIARAPISLLSLGETGWVQILDFIGTGLLALAAAAGIRRVLGSGRAVTWGEILIAMSGFGLILAGIFHPDPGYNFPPGSGAPNGMLPVMSAHAVIHSAGFAIVVLSLVAASFVLARAFRVRGERGWSRYSMATGIVGPVLLASGIASNVVPLITLMAIVLFSWLSAVSAHLRADFVRG